MPFNPTLGRAKQRAPPSENYLYTNPAEAHPVQCFLGRRRWSLDPGRGRENMDEAERPEFAAGCSLFLLNVVCEVVDPVMGRSQLGRIQRQLRAIEATDIRMVNLLLVIHPFIGRLQA